MKPLFEPREDDHQSFWSEDGLVACEQFAHLPDRCVACNEPASKHFVLRASEPLARDDRPLRVLGVVATLLHGGAISVRRSPPLELEYSLCAHHARDRWLVQVGMLVGAIVVLAGGWLAAGGDRLAALSAVIAGLVVLGLAILAWTRRLPRLADRRGLLRLGVAPAFLATIPPKRPSLPARPPGLGPVASS